MRLKDLRFLRSALEIPRMRADSCERVLVYGLIFGLVYALSCFYDTR